ncbi:hypothetical protein L1049_014886 [Liquidambar formosana]|uniref:F-box associated beta-propeller type 3 domain-containing protein n=1 Tax=Liquidambar formosana TaxID=63359 RepID=A0AAP0RWR6_LIQFO
MLVHHSNLQSNNIGNEGFELRFGQDIYLWNPAIQKFKALPNSSRHGNALCLAFGFFPRDNDYKVLKVFEGEERHKPAETEIYSLRANSWRMMQSVMPGKISYSSLETIHNGVLHCCGYRETGSHFILWVDMANEVFGEIKLPKCFCDQDDDDDKWSPLVDMFVKVSRKSLCLFFNDVSHGSMDVWVMKEYGVPESWTKQCSIGRPINSYAYPIGLMKNGEVVLKGYRGGGTYELLSYDQRVQEFKDIRIHGEPKFVKEFTHYMESLVLLNEGN